MKPLAFHKPISKPHKPTKFSPADVRAEKIAKGLCYYCDAPYDRNHKCQFKEPQLFTVEISGLGEVDAEIVEMVEEEVNMVLDPCISMSALSGSPNYHTMRVKAVTKGNPIHILIDSGSTHNFLDIHLAKKLGCELETTTAQSITVADDNHLLCQSICRSFTWVIAGQEITADVMLIPLESCDMVLGVQWLSTLGAIYWDFKHLVMKFSFNGVDIRLEGVPNKRMRVVDERPSVKLMCNVAQLCLLQVVDTYNDVAPSCLIHLATDSNKYEELESLKQKFAAIFEEPKDLPPHRGVFGHRINLEHGCNAVNIRPYRYPLKQRDIVEQLIQEMLERGIIQSSSSPFASPVVLVGKKDGTWRLCVDYRELNKRTVKNKFPIPVLDELIDELAGAIVFSKLDLRAGYHQLRIYPNDVFKTVFKTHEGHYEFLVMPFGLTNAPSSFQSWMNSVFKPLLRRCVLVFFDDILVYSPTLTDHWKHLVEVFELMSQHSLYAKLSKCSFVTKRVEYLGHFISEKGA